MSDAGQNIVRRTLTIANAASLSDPASIAIVTGTTRRYAVVGLQTPAEWDTAGIGFLVSTDEGSTYVQLRKRDEASAPESIGTDEVEILAADVPAAEAIYIPLDPTWFLGATHVKVQSQTSGTPVAQTPARTLYLVLRDIGA